MDMRKLYRFVCLSILALFPMLFASTTVAQTKKPIPIYDPARHKSNLKPMPRPSPRDTSQNSCSLITFEGLGDLASIPSFYGVSLPDWLSIIENNAGGSGNFAGEPSPVTIAFWLYGEPTFQSIQIPNGASQISLYYASYYSITLTGLDANGNVLTTVSGDANFDSGTNVYDVWSPLTINAPSGKVITTLNVSGYANYTGIDNLNVCQSPALAAVEPTQVIQQYQTLDDLKTSLKANGEPPVPMVAGKPAALRLYFNPVQTVSNVTVNLSGVSTDSKSVTLQPNCQPKDQRAGTNGCQSVDFYFTPPAGPWTATIDVLDSSGNNVEEEVLPFTSRTTDSLRLRGVTICDSLDATGKWNCADGSNIVGKLGLMTKIAPTGTVTADVTSNIIQADISDITSYPTSDDWWTKTVASVNGLYGFLDSASDYVLGRRSTYFGMVRPSPTDGTADPLGGIGGIADGIPSHGAMGRTSALRFNNNTETNVEVVAHEGGHTLGLKHTNLQNPFNITAPPGCYNFAADDTTDWKYPDNKIQDSTQLEYGFDVATHTILDPNVTFEVSSYCSPRWISPIHYKVMLATLGGGAVTSPSGRRPASQASARSQVLPRPRAAATAEPFWIVSGTINGSTVTFDPLFTFTTQGDTTTGTGTYSLQAQNAAGTALFTRNFTPTSASSESSGKDISGAPSFTQLLPVTSGATAIVLIGPGSVTLGKITLGGTAPTVAITAPTAGFNGTGIQTVSWTVSGASTYTSIVLYSHDNGTTWSQVARVANKTSVSVNFDALPGGTQSLIQVLVSDGVNTGTATSEAFTVPKKKPTVAVIDSPANNFAQPAADPLVMSGSVYDVDDGVLTGAALVWSSNVQGTLGTGSPLSMKLKPGKHTITLTGTDSDGNALSTSTDVILGGAPPVVNLQVQALNSVPTTCEYATLSATPGVEGGAPLSQVQYSVDGGSSYTTVPLGSLPYGFLVPGSGFLHVVARAYDISGQLAAQDATFFIQSACTLTTQTITFASLNDVTFGVAPITLTATASSGLPVTYAVTGPAKLSGSTLTITGVGVVTVTAEQAGNSTYAPATWISHTFNVLEATPTVTWAAPAAISYGTSLSGVLNAAATLNKTSVTGTYAYTAQPTGGAAAAVTPSTILPPGSYTLTVAFTPTDTTDINSASASVALTVNKETPAVAVTSSANPVIANSPITLTATLTAAYGSPTGSVNFLDGTTSLGSGTVANGVATYTTSTLAAGPHSITAAYSGDADFTTVTSSALAQTIQDFSIGAGTGGSSQTVKAGAVATYSLSIAPIGGTTIPAAVSFSATGLPSGATATFSPSSIASGSAATTVSLSVQTASTSAAASHWNVFRTGAAATSLCLVLLPFARRMRSHGRRFSRLLSLAILLILGGVAGAALSGCGGSSGSKQITPTTSTITITATAGALTHTTTVTLTVD